MTDGVPEGTVEEQVEWVLDRDPDCLLLVAIDSDDEAHRAVSYDKSVPAGGLVHLIGLAILFASDDTGAHPLQIANDAANVAGEHRDTPRTSVDYREGE